MYSNFYKLMNNCTFNLKYWY